MNNELNVGDSSTVGNDVIGGNKATYGDVYNFPPLQSKQMIDRPDDTQDLQREVSEIRSTLTLLVNAIQGNGLSYNDEGLKSIVKRLERNLDKMTGIVNAMQTNIETRLLTVESQVGIMERKIAASQIGGLLVAGLVLFLVFVMMRSLAG